MVVILLNFAFVDWRMIFKKKNYFHNKRANLFVFVHVKSEENYIGHKKPQNDSKATYINTRMIQN